MNNTTTEVKAIETEATAKKQRAHKTFDFVDVKGVQIPSKIKCSKCGREVSGYADLIYVRVMKDFGGSWNRYLKEWQCGDCKHAESNQLKEKMNHEKRMQQLKAAMELLKAEGFTVTPPKQEVKAAAKKAIQG